MAIEGFDYQEFAQILTSQVNELVPESFQEFEKNYVINTVKNFSTLCGEALYNDASLGFNAEQAMLITQIIAEWSFHKSIDLIKAGVMSDNWDGVMQKVAFTIFEIGKQAIGHNLPQEQLLQTIEEQVKKSYIEALEELKNRGVIDEELFNRAAHQSNIDEMMETIQQEEEGAEPITLEPRSDGQIDSHANSKILKLASVALLLKRVSHDKVQTILNKFNPQDADAVIQYMQMNDLEQKVDKNIAMKCLHEIKTHLPEPKQINPDKIIARVQKLFEINDRTKIEKIVLKERANVKEFVSKAYDGEYIEIPSKVANIIAQHLEENV